MVNGSQAMAHTLQIIIRKVHLQSVLFVSFTFLLWRFDKKCIKWVSSKSLLSCAKVVLLITDTELKKVRDKLWT